MLEFILIGLLEQKGFLLITIILDDGSQIDTDKEISLIDVESLIKQGSFMTVKNHGVTTSFPAAKISRILQYQTVSECHQSSVHKFEFPSTSGDDAVIDPPADTFEERLERSSRSFEDFKKAWDDFVKRDDEKDTTGTENEQ